jgi:signal transduction histidine kinase
MKIIGKTDAGDDRMRWVVLLLAVAVILPTVCLLWFMSQAVKNERLVVRQKLVTLYQDKLSETVRETDGRWSENCRFLDTGTPTTHPYEKLISAVDKNCFDGMIIYDSTGKRIYPLLATGQDSITEPSKIFSEAWEMEFIQKDYLLAARLYELNAQRGAELIQIAARIGEKLYGQKTEFSPDYIQLAALIGKSRCMAKLEMTDEAVKTCKQVAFSSLEETADSPLLVLIGDARLLLMNFIQSNKKYNDLYKETFNKLLTMVFVSNQAGFSLPTDHNLFLAQKALEIGNKTSFLRNAFSAKLEHIHKLITAEANSIRYSEYYPTIDAIPSRQTDRLQLLQAGKETLYGLYHKIKGGSLLVLLTKNSIASALVNYKENFKDSDVVYKIIDDSGRFVAGIEESSSKPFVDTLVGKHFPGWKVELYFKGWDVFEKAERKQTAVYTWTGVLVIVFILAAGGLAGQAVNKQIKINKLKNDFIATVSHELKTPLASMRVLVDTLLEGNYKDQQQVREYLELTSRENQRLSRLIDNFLTFSRMERNKQAFEMIESSPLAIARAAAEAVKTKFDNEQGRCKFDINISENLPPVKADRDAMVTVLVNLLDNAYKYSYENKKIELKVFSKDGKVCFQVSDNGTGMSYRATKKIFNRFYQVDRRLSRRAEGCGLGLSIAKFIVDAHKGSIFVESKPGEGSTFTVCLNSV